MPINTAKSHKSRKTEPIQQKPRKRATSRESAPASGSSSTATATTAPAPSNNAEIVPVAPPESAAVIPTVDPKTQAWYREPTSKTRKLFDRIMIMTVAGHSGAAIAKKLKTTEGNVRYTRWLGRKNRWCDEDDEPIDLEAELAHSIDRKIVRNIDASLDGQMTNWQTHEMTIAAAKGRGHFKNHDVVKQDGAASMSVVAIKVIMPAVGAGDQMPEIAEDQMGGVPAYQEQIEGEVVDEHGRARNDEHEADAAPVSDQSR